MLGALVPSHAREGVFPGKRRASRGLGPGSWSILEPWGSNLPEHLRYTDIFFPSEEIVGMHLCGRAVGAGCLARRRRRRLHRPGSDHARSRRNRRAQRWTDAGDQREPLGSRRTGAPVTAASPVSMARDSASTASSKRTSSTSSPKATGRWPACRAPRRRRWERLAAKSPRKIANGSWRSSGRTTSATSSTPAETAPCEPRGRSPRLPVRPGIELQVIGIPKTIDNDLAETDHSPGYPSAARFFACAVRDIGADNRALPGQVEFVEVLGRDAGWIVAATALARHDPDDAPHLVYFPEVPLPLDQLLEDVELRVPAFGAVRGGRLRGSARRTRPAFRSRCREPVRAANWP